MYSCAVLSSTPYADAGDTCIGKWKRHTGLFVSRDADLSYEGNCLRAIDARKQSALVFTCVAIWKPRSDSIVE
jgi:hypothetical protein